ncbi:hypothetical protein F52700_11485 [Fusarium sp. NRRL 52700]|nr:hypothetical protein F52700_11485 [Fusarium sp. NRRL 52700]
MSSGYSSQNELCFELLAAVKLIAESAQKCHWELVQHQVLSLKDKHIHLDNQVRDLAAQIRELKAANKDISTHAKCYEELGAQLQKVARDIPREARKKPVTLADITPCIGNFMEAAETAMGVMLVYHDKQKVQSTSNMPPTPATEAGDDIDNDAPVDAACGSPSSSHFTEPGSPPGSKRTSPDAEGSPSSKRRAHSREIAIAEIDEFADQKLTETPAGSGGWYVFQCLEHNLRFDGLARPAQAAARHAMTHGLRPTSASAIETFGIEIIGCDASIAKAHNDRVVVRPKKKATYHVKGAGDKTYRPQRGRRTNDDMASLLGDISPSNPRHIPVRQAAATRKRIVLSREPDGTEKPAEITIKMIYWIKWPDDGICYPAYVLPWESFPRFRSKYLAPVDRGLLESVNELPACYDKAHGLAGVWAEGYKDGQRKMNKRVYPVIFFTLGKRFPWECETAWAAEEDFRVFDGDKEDPRFKELVDHWRARENRQTPDDELVRMRLMSPPGDQRSSSSSYGDQESNLGDLPENENIDDESRNSFTESTECVASDRGSRRAESSDSDDDADDIGKALMKAAMESESRHIRTYLSQRMLHRTDTETRRRRRSSSMSPDVGTPASRPIPDEDEDSDIYGDDNFGPFPSTSPSEEFHSPSSRHDFEASPSGSQEFSSHVNERTIIPPSDDESFMGESGSQCQMDSSPLEFSSSQRVESTGYEEGIIRSDEMSTLRRLGSSEQRLREAMASAARQTNAACREAFREHSEEIYELLITLLSTFSPCLCVYFHPSDIHSPSFGIPSLSSHMVYLCVFNIFYDLGEPSQGSSSLPIELPQVRNIGQGQAGTSQSASPPQDVLHATLRDLWQTIERDKNTLIEALPELSDNSKDIFFHDRASEYGDIVNKCITKEARQIMGNGKFKIDDLKKLTPVSSKWPKEAGIYVLIYNGFGGRKIQDTIHDTAFYLGQTIDFNARKSNHQQSTKNGKKTVLYRLASKAKKMIMVPILIQTTSDVPTNFLDIAEFSMVCLLKSWCTVIFTPVGPSVIGSYSSDFAACLTFSRMMRQIRSRTDWGPREGYGLNWETPVFKHPKIQESWTSWYNPVKQLQFKVQIPNKVSGNTGFRYRQAVYLIVEVAKDKNTP